MARTRWTTSNAHERSEGATAMAAIALGAEARRRSRLRVALPQARYALRRCLAAAASDPWSGSGAAGEPGRAAWRRELPVGLTFDHRGQRVGDGGAGERRRRAHISKTTQPNAQMSVRLSTGCPRACSGLM